MRLHTTGTLLLTDLDDDFKHVGKSLDQGRATLVFGDELEATRVKALQDFAAAVLQHVVDAAVAVHEEGNRLGDHLLLLGLKGDIPDHINFCKLCRDNLDFESRVIILLSLFFVLFLVVGSVVAA